MLNIPGILRINTLLNIFELPHTCIGMFHIQQPVVFGQQCFCFLQPTAHNIAHGAGFGIGHGLCELADTQIAGVLNQTCIGLQLAVNELQHRCLAGAVAAD